MARSSASAADLTRFLRQRARALGASLTGFGDLAELADLPRAVVIALAHSPAALADLDDMPTAAYYQEYLDLNRRLDEIIADLADTLAAAGHRTTVNPATLYRIDPDALAAPFSHKMAATRAGLGWIGRSALLVTPEFGPALRLASLLTDAPLEVGTPIEESRCWECTACQEICPGGAISGELWWAGRRREEFYDARACQRAALDRARPRGIESTICGLCMAVCPQRSR